MEILTVLIYIITTFALTELLVYYDGFMHVFEYVRKILNGIHPMFGELMSCVVCTSSWVGIFLSALNYFVIDKIPFTPFNIILGETDYWWLIIFFDMCFTAGTTMLLNHMDEMMTLDEEEK